MKNIKYMATLFALFLYGTGTYAQSDDIEVTDSTSTEWSNGIGGDLSDIKQVIKGDVNGDGKVDAIDLTLVICDVLQQKQMPAYYIKAAADMDENKIVNAVDITLIINLIIKP